MRAELLIVGNPGPTHVGGHLLAGARATGSCVTCLNVEDAFESNRVLRKASWTLGRRPVRLRSFSQQVMETCRRQQPRWLVATGIAPIDRAALVDIGRLATVRINYLTDDPWNPAHKSSWFMRALPEYDFVFSTRRSNLSDLTALGCRNVAYLPFGYAPSDHFCQPLESPADRTTYAADVVFAGGADVDRVPIMEALIRAGFDVALYGGYWDRYAGTRRHARGHADAETLRKAIAGAKVALCLVRRANRDGSAMRTFEVAAMGGCMLAEGTDEHREIFGRDGDAVLYFTSTGEMLDRVRWLLEHDEERVRLGAAARAKITSNPHTYQDRLVEMLSSTTAGVNG